MNDFDMCRGFVRDLSSRLPTIQTLPISHQEND